MMEADADGRRRSRPPCVTNVEGAYLYLLVERDWRRAGTPCVVKVGRTADLRRRVASYPKHSRMVSCVAVEPARLPAAEAALKAAFREACVPRTDLGSEYFEVGGGRGHSHEDKATALRRACALFAAEAAAWAAVPEFRDAEEDDDPMEVDAPAAARQRGAKRARREA